MALTTQLATLVKAVGGDVGVQTAGGKLATAVDNAYDAFIAADAGVTQVEYDGVMDAIRTLSFNNLAKNSAQDIDAILLVDNSNATSGMYAAWAAKYGRAYA